MRLEEVRVLVVEHRLNGQLSMRVAAVGQLPADTCVIARPDPLWQRVSHGYSLAKYTADFFKYPAPR